MGNLLYAIILVYAVTSHYDYTWASYPAHKCYIALAAWSQNAWVNHESDHYTNEEINLYEFEWARKAWPNNNKTSVYPITLKDLSDPRKSEIVLNLHADPLDNYMDLAALGQNAWAYSGIDPIDFEDVKSDPEKVVLVLKDMNDSEKSVLVIVLSDLHNENHKAGTLSDDKVRLVEEIFRNYRVHLVLSDRSSANVDQIIFELYDAKILSDKELDQILSNNELGQILSHEKIGQIRANLNVQVPQVEEDKPDTKPKLDKSQENPQDLQADLDQSQQKILIDDTKKDQSSKSLGPKASNFTPLIIGASILGVLVLLAILAYIIYRRRIKPEEQERPNK